MPATSARPYIQFTELKEPSSARRTNWEQRSRRILRGKIQTADPAEAPGRSPTVPAESRNPPPQLLVWRLFSPAHRELGGSARAFETFSAARADARRRVARADDLLPVRVVRVARTRFAWYLLDAAGKPAAFSERWFESWEDRDLGLTAAMALLGQALIATSSDYVFPGHAATADAFPLMEPRLDVDALGEPVSLDLRRGARNVRDIRRSVNGGHFDAS